MKGGKMATLKKGKKCIKIGLKTGGCADYNKSINEINNSINNKKAAIYLTLYTKRKTSFERTRFFGGH